MDVLVRRLPRGQMKAIGRMNPWLNADSNGSWRTVYQGRPVRALGGIMAKVGREKSTQKVCKKLLNFLRTGGKFAKVGGMRIFANQGEMY